MPDAELSRGPLHLLPSVLTCSTHMAPSAHPARRVRAPLTGGRGGVVARGCRGSEGPRTPPTPPRPTDRGHQESYLLGVTCIGHLAPWSPRPPMVVGLIEPENFAARRQKDGARAQSGRTVRVQVHVGPPANASCPSLRGEGPTRSLVPHLSISTSASARIESRSRVCAVGDARYKSCLQHSASRRVNGIGKKDPNMRVVVLAITSIIALALGGSESAWLTAMAR